MPKAILCTQAIFFCRQAFSFLNINHAEARNFYRTRNTQNKRKNFVCSVFSVFKEENGLFEDFP